MSCFDWPKTEAVNEWKDGEKRRCLEEWIGGFNGRTSGEDDIVNSFYCEV